MLPRSVSAVILLLALLTSAAGNLVTAAFCPSFGTMHKNCGEVVPQPDVAHSGMTHDMHGMDRAEKPSDDSETAGSQSAGSAVAHDALANRMEEPIDGCSHCVTHSNVPANAPALRQSNTLKTSTHVDEPQVVVNIPNVLLLARVVNAREHAPPAPSSPLHVRLNVFRI